MKLLLTGACVAVALLALAAGPARADNSELEVENKSGLKVTLEIQGLDQGKNDTVEGAYKIPAKGNPSRIGGMPDGNYRLTVNGRAYVVEIRGDRKVVLCKKAEENKPLYLEVP